MTGTDWIARAESLDLEVHNLIDGRRSPVPGELINKYSARDGALLCQYGAGDAREVDRAVGAARNAFEDGRWSNRPAQQRKKVLLKWADLLEARKEEFALLESLDVGKPVRSALTFDVPDAAACIRWNAEACDKLDSSVYGANASCLSYQMHRPVGVVAGIVGWNFPLMLAADKMGPALAAGNCLVLKPSELTSLSAARVAELALEAGLPEGVLNVVHGDGVVGDRLARHRDIDLISFTGSSITGKRILIASGESNMKRLVLECGGKAPNIVFDDCPSLESVADAVVARAYFNQGQVCTASSRLLLHESIKDEFLPILLRKLRSLKPGDPLKEDTQFGALVSRQHLEKVSKYIRSGEQEGARVCYRCDAPPPHESGFYMGPVVFDEVSPHYTIAQEEIFGPVLCIMTFRDDAEAVGIANSTIYGLSAIIWTKDIGRALRVTRGIKSGLIEVNATETPGTATGAISVHGFKQSGLGSEGGIAGLQEYLSTSAVQIHA